MLERTSLVFALFLAGTACGTPTHHPIASVPDAASPRPDASACAGGGFCNVLVQAGCCASDKCTWILDATSPPAGHIACASDGTVPVGGTCTVGTAGSAGFDDCVRGAACFDSVCEQICDRSGGVPTCPAPLLCRVHPGFLGPAGMEAAGLCEPS